MSDNQGDVMAKNSVFKRKFAVSIWMLAVGVLVVLALFVLLWHPWAKALTANTRTVQVNGQASVKSTPDEFAFYPSYTSKNTDNQAALTELSKKSDEIVAKLKALGVPETGIKTNASSADGKYMVTMTYPNPESTGSTLQLTITVGTKDLAQKVQDYLLTTGATGSVSPSPTFSEAKQKQLESQARDEATKDARSKAEQMAKNLGFKLGPVKTVEEQGNFRTGMMGAMPVSATLSTAGVPDAGVTTMGTGAGAAGSVVVSSGAVAATATDAAGPKVTQLSVMPGQDEVSYSLSVTYYVR